MFTRNHPNCKPLNAKKSKDSERIFDQALAKTHFGQNYSPVLWNSKFSHLDMWPSTAHMMAVYGIHPETYLVRIRAPEFVDMGKMLVSGHYYPVAKIEDPYDLKPHPFLPGFMLPKRKQAQDLQLACLNVVYTNARISLNKAKDMVSKYRKNHRDIVIYFQMKDVLLCGGKIYKDSSSSFENVLLVGLPQNASLPFNII
ncbi:TPA: hypothetical protein OEI51_004947 [Escherichia coli]|nr:hypothetical protein [Escherichia coli]